MLLKYNEKIDIDGYLTLILSVFVIFATAGISYLFYFRKTLLFARRAKSHCDKNKMLCVLGKKLSNEEPDDDYLLRLERARILLQDDDKTEVLLLGGQTGVVLSEASAGKKYLTKNNIHLSRIHLEEKSTNTLENFLNAVDLLNNRKKEIVVISNRYHLARAKQLAHGLDLNVEVCAAEEKLSINTYTIFKILLEALHMHWHAIGRHYAHITKNNRIIERVG